MAFSKSLNKHVFIQISSEGGVKERFKNISFCISYIDSGWPLLLETPGMRFTPGK